ncbi:MAG: T9SS type A sorting domain-containing protein [Bacteroidota bacterium]
MLRMLFCCLGAAITLSFTHAQTNVWLGGTGQWTDASRWSLNQVPNGNHDVEIPNGSNVAISGGQARAASVEISSLATLNILNTSSLFIGRPSNTGINNFGTLNISGRLDIRHSTINNSATAIINNGTISVNTSGRLFINQINTGIYNYGLLDNNGRIFCDRGETGLVIFDNSQFINRSSGFVRLRFIRELGISTDAAAAFTNQGHLLLGNGNQNFGLIIRCQLENTQSGLITLNHTDNILLLVTGYQAHLINRGQLQFNGTGNNGTGMRVDLGGRMTNTSTARIEFSSNNQLDQCLVVASGGRLDNFGQVEVHANGDMGVKVIGSMSNTNQLQVTGAPQIALLNINGPGSYFLNLGGRTDLTHTAGGKALEIFSSSELINDDCGTMNINGDIFFGFTGQLENQQAWFNHYSGEISSNSSFDITNSGLYFDGDDAMANATSMNLTNGALILRLQDYQPTSGSFRNNVFRRNPNSNVTAAPTWRALQTGGQVLANYNQTTNQVSFINNLPSDINAMYTQVNLPGCGSNIYEIGFTQASPRIVPISSPDFNQVSSDSDLMVYPNPVQDQINIRLHSPVDQDVSIKLYDIQGREMAFWASTAGRNQIELPRPAHAVSGIHILQLIYADGRIDQKRLVLE